jgi:uncharacterized protein (TIGR03905 family)
MTSFTPQGVCATRIDFSVDEDGILSSLAFNEGCPGNAQGVSRLAVGRPAAEVAELLQGLPCGNKPTSCPDQLAKALKAHLGSS